jgi:hypothetical protein
VISSPNSKFFLVESNLYVASDQGNLYTLLEHVSIFVGYAIFFQVVFSAFKSATTCTIYTFGIMF